MSDLDLYLSGLRGKLSESADTRVQKIIGIAAQHAPPSLKSVIQRNPKGIISQVVQMYLDAEGDYDGSPEQYDREVANAVISDVVTAFGSKM